ncbi:hypothetical protein M0802_001401 [Mischocyttarus mexicanus]|nr:hypothetical protein M0802_001401 [Mischocyttarus mexicanus]
MQDVAKVQSKGERSRLRGCGGDGYLRCDPELPSSSSSSVSSSFSSFCISYRTSLPFTGCGYIQPYQALPCKLSLASRHHKRQLTFRQPLCAHITPSQPRSPLVLGSPSVSSSSSWSLAPSLAPPLPPDQSTVLCPIQRSKYTSTSITLGAVPRLGSTPVRIALGTKG